MLENPDYADAQTLIRAGSILNEINKSRGGLDIGPLRASGKIFAAFTLERVATWDEEILGHFSRCVSFAVNSPIAFDAGGAWQYIEQVRPTISDPWHAKSRDRIFASAFLTALGKEVLLSAES